MNKVAAQPIETNVSLSNCAEIIHIDYGLGELRAVIRDVETKREFIVSFSEVLGFRVLDERDLMEYWPVCSTPNGWLFEINSNGWLSHGGNCLLVHHHPNAKEYLVTGEDDCLNVICQTTPQVAKHAL